MTYLQWQGLEGDNPIPDNTLNGPEEPMGPEFRSIVAINVDTLYVGAFIDLTAEPMILTLTQYAYTYSNILVDGFGTVMSNNFVPVASGAVYAFVGPGYAGDVPHGTIRVSMDVNWFLIGIRADKYFTEDGGNTYEDVIIKADTFRQTLRLLPLSEWMMDPTKGVAQILPLSTYAISVKGFTDLLATTKPKSFMELLQAITADPSTAPLSRDDQKLIHAFNRAFAAAQGEDCKQVSALFQLAQGIRAAQSDIVSNWKSLTAWSNWVHPDSLGDWGDCYLNRASGNEFIQYGNLPSLAYYAHAFVDINSNSLLGEGNGYTLTFTAVQLPTYTRFFSVTAYLPGVVELIPNRADKYAVASYTPNLLIQADGSLTMYISVEPPVDAELLPNWLPVSPIGFSLMLRVYGPLGTALAGTYVPPPIIPS